MTGLAGPLEMSYLREGNETLLSLKTFVVMVGSDDRDWALCLKVSAPRVNAGDFAGPP